MDTLKINKEFLESLLSQAKDNPRLRQNYDLRTCEEDKSQRMLNALMPGTEVAIHRHPASSESVICLCGRMDVVIYEEVVAYVQNGEETTSQVSYNEIDRVLLCPAEGIFGCSIPKGAWHTVEVFEPSVIFEAKDRAYGEDGSEVANVD